MLEIVNDIKTMLTGIHKSPIISSNKNFRFITEGTMVSLKSQIAQLAKIIEPEDDQHYKLLLEIHDKAFDCFYYPKAEPTYAIDFYYCGALDAITDFMKSDLYASKFKRKRPRIFISHSKKDLPYINAFVDMLVKIGIKQEHLFCSSVDGYRIPLGEDIYDYLQSQFEDFSLYVIFMLSRNYYKNIACLNEMGAAWVLKTEYQAILLPKFSFSKVDGAINPRKCSFELCDMRDTQIRKGRLTELKNILLDKLGLPGIDEILWENHRNEFIEKIDTINASSQFTAIPVSQVLSQN